MTFAKTYVGLIGGSSVTGNSVFDRASEVAVNVRLSASRSLLDSRGDFILDIAGDVLADRLDLLTQMAGAFRVAAESFIFESAEAGELATAILDKVEARSQQLEHAVR